ncbi:hypothetical protein [Jeongeupia sp. USM3]|uniref:hypothetical protein n=1 Tax=Jeongeupia sp. USM3 TaxID=1906741 RepID=UPI0009F42A91|nr:hypothetical protein [Jeongeupia sp. USM3]
MSLPEQYCTPVLRVCRTMQEWAVYWQAVGVVAAIVFGSFGLYKIYHELRRLNEQREKDASDKETAARLKRTEFFLSQHRRLFDDKDLFEVLCLIDGDNARLANKKMWDKKRKLLVFFEEIALLVRSNQIEKNVAFYMFGYYSLCARYGSNFSRGINPSREHWALFYEFSDGAQIFLNENVDGPSDDMFL